MSAQADLWLGQAGAVLLALGAAGLVRSLLLSSQSPLRVKIEEYRDQVESDLRFLHLRATGKQVLSIQSGAFLLLPVFIYLSGEWLWAGLLLAVAVVPRLWLTRQRENRITRIEEQLDGWLLVLANALKASSSLGEAVASSAALLHAPLGQEIDLLLKEYRLGTPLDQAMETMSRRIGSRTVASALLTLRVARNTGGDLPAVLERSAASLRELCRLEGVARTKTAEGKAQTLVIGIIPFALFGALHALDPEFLRPLAETFTGHLVVAGSATLWLAAVIIARKILVVDI